MNKSVLRKGVPNVQPSAEHHGAAQSPGIPPNFKHGPSEGIQTHATPLYVHFTQPNPVSSAKPPIAQAYESHVR